MTGSSNLPHGYPRLTGRRAVVTGGTTGIGRAIAVSLAAAGVRVFVCGHDEAGLAAALAAIRAVGEGDGIAIDLAEPGAVDRVVAAGEAAMGGLDIAVMNAAVAAQGLTQMDADAIARAIAVNFTAYVMGAKAASLRMVPTGDLILIGSLSAQVLGPGSTVYAGIKAGIAGFAKALRRELGPKGIRVSLIEPGKTESAMQSPGLSAAAQTRMIEEETMLQAEDIADAVLYLLSRPSRTVVQQLVIVPRAQEGE